MDSVDHRRLAHGDRFDLAQPPSQLPFDETAGATQIAEPHLVDVDLVDGGEGVDHSECARTPVVRSRPLRDACPVGGFVDREARAVVHEDEGHIEHRGVVDDVDYVRDRDIAVMQGRHDPALAGDVVGAATGVAERGPSENPPRMTIDGDREGEIRPTDRHDLDVEVGDIESVFEPRPDAVCVESCWYCGHHRPPE